MTDKKRAKGRSGAKATKTNKQTLKDLSAKKRVKGGASPRPYVHGN